MCSDKIEALPQVKRAPRGEFSEVPQPISANEKPGPATGLLLLFRDPVRAAPQER